MRGLSRAINRRIILPAYYRKNGDKRLQRLAELEKTQWLDKADIETLQNQRLRALIQHCYDSTDYYRALLDQAGIKPADIRSSRDLRYLPTLTKASIQAHRRELVSNRFRREDLVEDASGGSTGVQTNFLKDVDRHRHRRADQIRHDQWSGWRLGEPYALIWGAAKDLSRVRSLKEKFVSRFVDRAFLFDAFEMKEDNLEAILSRLEKIRPTMILGYANALHLFARQIKERNRFPPQGLRGIISSAESLSESKRKDIQDVLSCKVLNRYGSREVGLIASECDRQEGLHINAENVVVEILNGNDVVEPGQRGEIVVTDLLNYGMPFIRYRMGDTGYATDSMCSCGRGLPLMGAVEGRVSDFFTAADGTKVHGEYFTHLFYGIPEVRQFQLVQESLDKVVLRIVADRTDLDSALGPVVTAIKQSLGSQARVEVAYCDEIAPTASGKYLFTISKLAY